VGDRWLWVVVKYVAADAFVLSAFLTDKPKKERVKRIENYSGARPK